MKKTKKSTLMALVAIAVLLVSILIVNYLVPQPALKSYKMELYVKLPSGSEIKVRECYSSLANFQCIKTYSGCPEKGVFYGKAVTYTGKTILGQSDWEELFSCS